MTQPRVKPPPTLGRQVRAAGALVAILALVAGAAWGVYRLSVGRPVLAGTRVYDFGIVQLDGKETMLAHTFALVNRSSRGVEIAGINTSCGCTAAEPSATAIEPGGEVDIEASLKLTRHGKKDAIVFVHYAGGQVDQLKLIAEARQAKRLSVAVGPAASGEDDSFERLLIYMDYDSSARPPAPDAFAPPGIRVRFGPWEQTAKRSRRAGFPAYWKAAMVITREGDLWPGEGTLTVRLEDQAASISLP